MRKLRHRAISLAKGHTVSKWQSCDLNPHHPVCFHDTTLPVSGSTAWVSFGFDFRVQIAIKFWLSQLKPVWPVLPSPARTSFPAIMAALSHQCPNCLVFLSLSGLVSVSAATSLMVQAPEELKKHVDFVGLWIFEILWMLIYYLLCMYKMAF